MKYIRLCGIVIAVLTLLLSLTGCDPWVTDASANRRPADSYHEDVRETKPANNSDIDSQLFVMEHVGEHDTFDYYRDTITDVLYLRTYLNGPGLTVMMDPETGLPLTYTRYMELADQKLNTNKP